MRTKVRLGGPIGEFIGFQGGDPIKEHTRTLVQGSHVRGIHLICHVVGQ